MMAISIAASKTFKPPIAINAQSWDYANGAIDALCAAGYKVSYTATQRSEQGLEADNYGKWEHLER